MTKCVQFFTAPDTCFYVKNRRITKISKSAAALKERPKSDHPLCYFYRREAPVKTVGHANAPPPLFAARSEYAERSDAREGECGRHRTAAPPEPIARRGGATWAATRAAQRGEARRATYLLSTALAPQKGKGRSPHPSDQRPFAHGFQSGA